jgi:predicted Zn-dependent peptidase
MQWRASLFLKSASIQAATLVAAHAAQMGWSGKHVSRLYGRIRREKGHSIAVDAVARHLSEAAFWMLTKREPY